MKTALILCSIFSIIMLELFVEIENNYYYMTIVCKLLITVNEGLLERVIEKILENETDNMSNTRCIHTNSSSCIVLHGS